MRVTYAFFVLFCSLASLSHAQYTETINSNRPGNSQGAFSVGTGVIQLEAGAKMGEDRHELQNTHASLWGIDYAARVGLFFEQLEFSVMGSFLSQDTEYLSGGNNTNYAIRDFQSNTIGAKYLLYDPYKNAEEEEPNLYSWHANRGFKWSHLIPAVSLYAGANLAAKDNPYLYPEEDPISPRVAVITQNNFEGGWVLVLNIIGDKIGQEYPSYTGMVTLTHSFSPKFAAFGEFQTIISDIYSDEIVRAGLAYLFHKNFQLDLSGLLNFKDTPSRWQAALGLSYRFDFHKDEYTIPQ